MTDLELFEFIVVIIEIGAFMLILTLGAVVLEVIIPRLLNIIKILQARLKSDLRGERNVFNSGAADR